MESGADGHLALEEEGLASQGFSLSLDEICGRQDSNSFKHSNHIPFLKQLEVVL